MEQLDGVFSVAPEVLSHRYRNTGYRMNKLCKTRNDVYRLLLDNPGSQFYVQDNPGLLHVFEECLLMPFITIDRDTEVESYKFHVKESELNKLWVKYK